MAAFPSAHVPGPQPELLSRPGQARFRARRRPWGSLCPSQCRSRPRLAGVSSMPAGPTCRFAAAPSASVLSRDPTVTSGSPGVADAAPGFVRGPDVPRRPPVPPRLLRTGPDAPRWPGLPWAFGPLSGLRPPVPASPLLAALTPVGFGASSSSDCRSGGGERACPSACRRGRRLIGPTVFPPGRCPRLRFLRRPPNVVDSRRRVALGGLL